MIGCKQVPQSARLSERVKHPFGHGQVETLAYDGLGGPDRFQTVRYFWSTASPSYAPARRERV